MTESAVPEGEGNDSPLPLPTHRRSTYTPPAEFSPSRTAEALGADDDTLAAALADELARATRTGSDPVSGSTQDQSPSESSEPADAAQSAVATGSGENPVSESQAETLPSIYTPPKRRSLPDDALMQKLAADRQGEGATIDAMEQLERQLQLRQADAQAFALWEQSMAALGTPKALDAIDRARSGFSDVIATPSAPAAPEAAPPPPGDSSISDIPPPPGASEPTDAAVVEAATVDSTVPAPPDIPELIEPHSIGDEPLPVGTDFDTLLGAAARAAGEDGDEEQADAAPGDDEAGAFPLEVYEPGEHVPETLDLVAPRAFRIELAGLEPTPLEQRVGRSARLFWMWFATNSSVLSVALGAVLFSLGMSLRQSIIAALVGVSISSLPLGIGALAGKRSGQPTMVVSRATFGLIGNVLPALLAFLTRIFWGAVLLWALALGVATVLDSVGVFVLDMMTLTFVSLGAALVLATVIAVFGYGLIARVQATLTILSVVLVAGFIMLSWAAVDLRAAIAVPDGDWMLVATASVLVFSFTGLVWAVSSADFARYQSPHSSSAGSMLWSWFGAALPAFVLIAYGSVLAASNPALATGLLERPIETLTLLVPAVYVYPLLAALGLGLFSGAIMAIYSGGFALQAVGVRAPRWVVVVIVAVLTGAAAAGILVTLTDFEQLIRDLATTIAVPIAAWVGVFSAEIMMRSRRYDSASLLRRGGIYASFRWVNLVTLVVATALGYAFTSAAVSWLSWQGFGWELVGIEADSTLATTDLGVIGALVLALLVTVIVGKPAINRQELDDDIDVDYPDAGYSDTLGDTAGSSAAAPAHQAAGLEERFGPRGAAEPQAPPN